MNEPPLIAAILSDDIEAVKKLSGDREALKERNWLGFNGTQIALFLKKDRALDILLPGRSRKRFKVLPKGEDSLREMGLKEYENLFQVNYHSHLSFADYDLLKQVVRSCPWLIANTSLGDRFRELGEKHEWELYKGFVSDVSIRWIDDRIGYGLFAEKTVRPDEFVIEYAGMVIPVSLERAVRGPYSLRYARFFFSLNYFIVDNQFQGNESRFINHSFKPNLTATPLYNKGLLPTGMIANREIAKGEQLTFNYGKGYWRARRMIPID